MKPFHTLAAVGVVIAVSSCGGGNPNTQVDSAYDLELRPRNDTGRWYSKAQVKNGQKLYAQYCAACHGERAASIPNWKTVDDNGNYPPPPLDGSAHAWHHSIPILDRVIKDGGEPVGGVMPAFGSLLNVNQRIDIIASFQNYWTDDIYENWLQREHERGN